MDRSELVITSLDGTEYELLGWLTACLGRQLPHRTRRVDIDVPLAEYGVDSVVALGLYGEIEDAFGLRLDPGVVFEHPTVHRLARCLALRAAGRPAGRGTGAGS
ncbi:acyl carrier protein [Kitasatospora sp. MAP5-34]|uniref:acyl carrier protein n=1 Tax=Kitasatospora sp. MAP5-34 TaxID=3035102 RepID=UPI0024745FED|nr:acyl carrier protein [Kitasatospora sp. MAP5-34]MDH6579755.1 acyl carrier protein [Kitasatospora sp. MAP5-34]